MSHFDEYQRALDDEIAEQRRTGSPPTHLSRGTCVEQFGLFCIYSFELDRELTLTDNTPVRIEVAGREVSGRVQSVHQHQILLQTEGFLGRAVPEAKLHSDPWFLLEELKSRLLTVQATRPELPAVFESEAGMTECGPGGDVPAMITELSANYGQAISCNTEQIESIEHLLLHNITYLWGPPGTGKTRTLGLAADCLVKLGERVLILAHSNAAVDVAILAAARHLRYTDDYYKGRILRYGFCHSAVLEDLPKVTAKGALEAQDPNLFERLEELEKQKSDYLDIINDQKADQWRKDMAAAQLRGVQSKIVPIYEEIEERERRLLRAAKIVACTLSKAAIDDAIHAAGFDAVLVDEASMALIPQCVFAGSLARKRIGVFGDFRQLPPIALAETPAAQRWLARDIYQSSGIENAVNEGREDSRLTVLKSQYRMHPKIVSVINPLYYNGLLSTDAETEARTSEISGAWPEQGGALAVMNLGRFPSFSFLPSRSGSRFNPYSALVTIEVVAEVLTKWQDSPAATSIFSLGVPEKKSSIFFTGWAR